MIPTLQHCLWLAGKHPVFIPVPFTMKVKQAKEVRILPETASLRHYIDPLETVIQPPRNALYRLNNGIQ
jgi:hypothetical protein